MSDRDWSSDVCSSDLLCVSVRVIHLVNLANVQPKRGSDTQIGRASCRERAKFPHPTRQFLTESLVDGERSQSKSFSSCARIGRIFSLSASSPLRFNS